MLDISKDKTRRTNTYYRQKLSGVRKYRIRTVSDKCHLGVKPGLRAPNPTLITYSSYKTYSVNKSTFTEDTECILNRVV